MSIRVSKLDTPIKGIKCVVNACNYWDQNHCYAKEIEVQAPNATSTEMTDCATFAPKGGWS